MKLVKFKDGLYGIRRGFWPFYEYLTLGSESSRYWFSNGYSTFERCCRAPREQAERIFNLLTDDGSPV